MPLTCTAPTGRRTESAPGFPLHRRATGVALRVCATVAATLSLACASSATSTGASLRDNPSVRVAIGAPRDLVWTHVMNVLEAEDFHVRHADVKSGRIEATSSNERLDVLIRVMDAPPDSALVSISGSDRFASTAERGIAVAQLLMRHVISSPTDRAQLPTFRGDGPFTEVPPDKVIVPPGPCEFPAEPVGSREKIIFLVIESSDTAQRLVPLVAAVAQELGTSLRRTGVGENEARLALADGEYHPWLLFTSARATLQGDGLLTNLALDIDTEPRFTGALTAAVDSFTARGGMGPFDERGREYQMPLRLSFSHEHNDSSIQVALFRLHVPLSLPAVLLSQPRAPNPLNTLPEGGSVAVSLRFLVDEHGAVVRESIRSEPPKYTAPPFLSAFRSLERQTIQAVSRFRYRPAQLYGCLVKAWTEHNIVITRVEAR